MEFLNQWQMSCCGWGVLDSQSFEQFLKHVLKVVPNGCAHRHVGFSYCGRCPGWDAGKVSTADQSAREELEKSFQAPWSQAAPVPASTTVPSGCVHMSRWIPCARCAKIYILSAHGSPLARSRSREVFSQFAERGGGANGAFSASGFPDGGHRWFSAAAAFVSPLQGNGALVPLTAEEKRRLQTYLFHFTFITSGASWLHLHWPQAFCLL